MSSFNIVWTKARRLWFISNIGEALNEYSKKGQIDESFFDKLRFALDKDDKGMDYPLVNPSIITSRSCDPYHPYSIADAKSKIDSCETRKVEAFSKLEEKYKSILSENTKCEAEMKKMMIASNDHDGQSYDAPTMAQIEKLKLDQLLSFYYIRTHKNIKECRGKVTKGTTAKVLAGKKCSVTRGLFLIDRVFRCRTKPKILSAPTIPEEVMDDRQSLTITHIAYNEDKAGLDYFHVTAVWLENAYRCIDSIKNFMPNDYPVFVKDLDALSDHAFVLANKLLSRLCPFLASRIPTEEKKLLPPYHWVWKSLKSKLVRLCVIMILGRGVPDIANLKLRKEKESYLRLPNMFSSFNESNGNLDGCYLYADIEKGCILRSGSAEASFCSRGKQHEAASKRRTTASRGSKFYTSYPHAQADSINVSMQRGTFQDLRQLVAIGIEREKKSDILGLFKWNKEELDMLSTLPLPSAIHQGVEHKQYKHIVYFLETVYALAISPEHNLSENPGCEWQLNYSRIINNR